MIRNTFARKLKNDIKQVIDENSNLINNIANIITDYLFYDTYQRPIYGLYHGYVLSYRTPSCLETEEYDLYIYSNSGNYTYKSYIYEANVILYKYINLVEIIQHNIHLNIYVGSYSIANYYKHISLEPEDDYQIIIPRYVTDEQDEKHILDKREFAIMNKKTGRIIFNRINNPHPLFQLWLQLNLEILCYQALKFKI